MDRYDIYDMAYATALRFNTNPYRYAGAVCWSKRETYPSHVSTASFYKFEFHMLAINTHSFSDALLSASAVVYPHWEANEFRKSFSWNRHNTKNEEREHFYQYSERGHAQYLFEMPDWMSVALEDDELFMWIKAEGAEGMRGRW